MGKTKHILAIAIVAIIGSLIFWKRDWLKDKLRVIKKLKPASEPGQSASTSTPSAMPGATYTACDKFPLKLGCSGEKVRALQKALNRNFNAGISVDGDFGTETETALVNAGFGKELELNEIVKVMI